MVMQLDTAAFGDLIKGPVDTRYWFSHGIVGTVDNDGEFDPTDAHAVVIAADGVWCDVMLAPLMVPVTARMQLGVGGNAHILAPIHPGDEVVVGIPDGQMMQPAVILAILNSQHTQIPLDADKHPTFKNDRLLIQCGKDLPVEIHAHKVQIGDSTAAENLILGQQFKAWANDLMQAVLALTVPTAMGPSGPPVNTATFTALKNRIDGLLSTFAFTQKDPPTHGT